MSGCVQNTNSVHLTAQGGILTADVQVSAQAGNQLSLLGDGLFATGAPTGALMPYAGAAAPAGWLLADGSAVSRATYAALFAVISTTYGVGNGSTTFNVPDMGGRVAVGFVAAGGHVDVSTLGANDGAILANRRPKHNHTHTLTLPDHAHSHTLTLPNHGHLDSIDYQIGIQGGPGGDGTQNPPNTINNRVFQYWDQNQSSGDSGGDPYLKRAGSVGNPTSTPAINGSVTGVTSTPGINGVIGPAGTNPADAAAYLVLNHIIKT